MCTSKKEGGHRCATATRCDYQEALARVTSGSLQPSDLTRLAEAAAAHASTPGGLKEVITDSNTVSPLLTGILKDAEHKGRSALAARQAGAMAAALARKTAEEAGSVRTPGGWVLSHHVIQQGLAKGFTLEDLVSTTDKPGHTYPNGRYEGQERRILGNIVLAVDVEKKRAITCYENVTETDLRDDQREQANRQQRADALRYDETRKN